MISRADTRQSVAAEEKGVLPLVSQRSDTPFGKAVVYRIRPVLSVQENLLPKMVEIIDRLPHQASLPRNIAGFHQVK